MENEINLREYFRIISKRKKIISGFALVGLMAGGFLYFSTPVSYNAKTYLEVEDNFSLSFEENDIGTICQNSDVNELIYKVRQGFYSDSKITADNPPGTHIIGLNFSSDDPEKAKRILQQANSKITQENVEAVEKAKEQGKRVALIKVIKEPEIISETNPDLVFNLISGGLLGLFLGIIFSLAMSWRKKKDLFKKSLLGIAVILFFSIALSAEAEIVGEKKNFFVDPGYDALGRKEITAVLLKTTDQIYFYADQEWWNFVPQNEIYQKLTELEQEFEENIYLALTSTLGREWNPGIDKDPRITFLIHPMKSEAGGYFRSNDEYYRLQIPDSNQREMIYLNSKYITSNLAKSFLAHEFVHLITFNQKENAYNVVEDVWLNEARAEYASTLAGYDDVFEGSNLEKRVDLFYNNPSDPLLDWRNSKDDYGVVNLFIHYLVDHYGLDILIDSLQSPNKGVESLNYALEKNGFEQDFSDIFLDWTVASLINDCNYGNKYCYLNPNLANVHVGPDINFLPVSGESSLTFSNFARKWSGNWYKIIGGKEGLKVDFSGNPKAEFRIIYILQGRSGSFTVKSLDLDNDNKAELYFDDFGKETTALFLLPCLKSGNDYSIFSWTVSSVSKNNDSENQELINSLLTKIDQLKKQIAFVRNRIEVILARKSNLPSAPKPCVISNSLYYGLNNDQVKCLQEFLKSQGNDIYPEGLATGFFGPLTRDAVIRFQEKYAQDILFPLGLQSGTGFVGVSTKKKINSLMGQNL